MHSLKINKKFTNYIINQIKLILTNNKIENLFKFNNNDFELNVVNFNSIYRKKYLLKNFIRLITKYKFKKCNKNLFIFNIKTNIIKNSCVRNKIKRIIKNYFNYYLKAKSVIICKLKFNKLNILKNLNKIG